MKKYQPWKNIYRWTTLSQIVALGLIASPAALAVTPAELEGEIFSVTDNGNGTGSMVVMGVPVVLNASTIINSPTAALSIAALADTATLPGRIEPGFVGGTAIVIGNSDGGVVTAINVTVEPSENIVIGEVTNNGDALGCVGGSLPIDGALSLNGMPVTFLADPRMPFSEATNEGGFPINPCSLVPGAAASVEGYASNGNFYAFAFASDDAELVGSVNLTSISRAQCREQRGRLSVRGATTTPNGNVTITDETTGQVLGTAGVEAALTGGVYRLRVNLASCPQIVRATHDDGSFGIAEAEIQ